MAPTRGRGSILSDFFFIGGYHVCVEISLLFFEGVLGKVHFTVLQRGGAVFFLKLFGEKGVVGIAELPCNRQNGIVGVLQQCHGVL